MTAVFEITADMNAKDASTIASVNQLINALAERRVARIELECNFLRSKLAWNVACHRQSILYRLVALASGCALNWNAGNQLCSMLAARSLIETVASLHSFEKERSKSRRPIRQC
jgi:hypothetical protein